ncbi:MAG: Zn-dependent hydrolase [Deltaproteobacteria bacterium]|nr:MAG: Zn-dependent hydrolase [Deltaproteobacteria bacterium]
MAAIIETPAFKIHQITGYICELYIVEYPDRLLLLDGGCSTDTSRISTYITRHLKRSLADLRLVVVTHIHPDHAGGSDFFRKKGIPIAAPAGINQWYAGPGGFIQHKIDICLSYLVVYLSRSPIKSLWYHRQVQATTDLFHKSRLPAFDDWTVICVPGHTWHDIALYHPDSGILYAGDTLIRVNGRFNLPFPVSYPDAMTHSLERLRYLPIRTALLAHGGMLSGDRFKAAGLEAVRTQHRPQRGVIGQIRFLAKFSPQAGLPAPRIRSTGHTFIS